MARRNGGPPRHLIEPAQHRVDFARFAAKAAALDGREHVALQQHAFGPLRRKRRCVVPGQTHEVSHAAAAICRLSAIQRSRSDNARALIACFLATVFSLPRSRVPSGFFVGGLASGGNRPKLMFIGWKARAPGSRSSIWPPGGGASSGPKAGVGGGGNSPRPRASAAPERPAIKPMLADST